MTLLLCLGSFLLGGAIGGLAVAVCAAGARGER